MRLPLAALTTLTVAQAITSVAAPSLSGQGSSPRMATTVDSATRARVISGVLARLDEGYVVPERAKAMAQAVRQRERAGAYQRIDDGEALAVALTRDLQAVSHDRHLRVVYRPGGVADESPEGEPGPAQRKAREAFGRKVNYGLERVERLAGKVGYLEIRSFDFDAALVDSALSAAMSFLGRTDALIVDVRRNGGGDPGMVAAVCSYFMPAGRLINRFYWRPANRWDEFRTRQPTGPAYGTTRPVYVLTSDGTFSAAEEFAYDVQTQRRGEIVGDTTGGGAHPGGMRQVTEQFGVWVPSGRAVNPVTGTNWEGIGVRPDVPVPAADALRTAHLRALERLLAAARDDESRAALRAAIDQVRAGSSTS
jgi:hypothetical protein